MRTGNFDMYRLSHSHENLLQSKTKYMHMLILYICFQTCSYMQSHIVSKEYCFFVVVVNFSKKQQQHFFPNSYMQICTETPESKNAALCKNVRTCF